MSTAIERLEALAEAQEATKRPWRYRVTDGGSPEYWLRGEDFEIGLLGGMYDPPTGSDIEPATPHDQRTDADLIVAAVNALPDLLKLARAAGEWERCRQERENLAVPFGATPGSYAEMGRMTEEAGRANEALRIALDPLFREETPDGQ